MYQSTSSLKYGRFAVTAIALFFILTGCRKNLKWLEVDPAYAQYVESYTTGSISKTSSVRVRLSQDAKTTHSIGEPVKENLFEFTPDVKGKAVWIDARTIEFKPDNMLKPDELYNVDFNLGKVTTVPSKFGHMKFSLHTLAPAFRVTENGLRSSGSKETMFLNGNLETSDFEDPALVEKILSAQAADKNLKLVWQHSNNNKTHSYSINNIPRGVNENTLHLKWEGSPLHITNKGEKTIAVPSQTTFKVMDVRAVNEAQQYASVLFSNPIAIGQDLNGFITVGNQSDLTYSINGSEVRVFISGKADGNYTVNINPGIKDGWGGTLASTYSSNIVFETRFPSVKIIGRGNILPSTGKLVLPFDAINLNAVDVSIIKIYERNVPQFLQENDIAGDNELRRVARPVVQKTIRLDDDKTLDLHQRQRFSLDIDKFLKTEPGAIYRVTLGFRPDYSLYNEGTKDTTKNEEGDEEEEYDEDYHYYSSSAKDDDDEFWDRYDTYYPYGYDWRRRDDPASKSYYNKERWATRNILSSNLGLTVKRGETNQLTVAVTSLQTTEPVQGVELEVLDYQLQVLTTSTSGADGFAKIDVNRKPYLVIAKKGQERGYLKVDDGSALALSRFDVGGEIISHGIKGFIFGERGVWRPGDSMYINCILEDKAGKLPADIPVEFSLITPRGQLYRNAILSNAPDQFYVFKTATENSAPTGNWLVRVKAGGAVFEKRMKVETVMPNRLKINLDFGQNAILGTGSTNEGNLDAAWLFGTPARNLKAKVDATLSKRKTSFDKYKEFDFDSPVGNFETQAQSVYDGTLDENGHAKIKPDFNVEGIAPGMLTANLLVKVFEPGGAFSINNLSLPYSPFNSYAGLKLPEGEKPFDYLLAGKAQTVDLVNVNRNGQALQGNQEMEVQYYKLEWRWWWDDGGDNLSNFTQDQYNKLLIKQDVTLTNGKGQWKFTPSSDEWGRYLILVKDKTSGHVAGKVFYIDGPGWQSRGAGDDQSAATMLSFTSDKEKYAVGEDISLRIPSAKGGRMLVSLENGSKVLKTFWKETEAGQTKISFKAEKDMAPNIYATVSLLQPHAQTLNDLPIRMYGSLPLFIEDKNTILKPVISMPESVRPEKQVSVTVSESAGREMTYCIAVVDEGLLDLTRFKTPDPHEAFYAREALGVRSFDMFDYVIGAWGGDLERILTIGGDEDAGPSKQKSANRFKPVVKYLGPFHLPAGQKQTRSFMMPAYVGSVRTMVVAAHKGQYGMAEKAVAVKKPVMVLTTLPRMLSPGENIRVPVTVFAMEDQIKNVDVKLEANNLFELTGPATQQVQFSKPGEQMVYFDVRVREGAGIGKIKASVSSGAESSFEETELDVRNPNPVVNSVQQVTLGPGQSWSGTANIIGIPAQSTGTIELSSIPALGLQKRLKYLIEYPHGCIEQTTSAVFPQIVLNQLIELNDQQKQEVDKNVKAGIMKLQNFQRPEGGFSYWPAGFESDDWGSSYAGHFLVEAQANGYFVPDNMLQNWKNFQKGKASSWAPSTTNFYGGDLAQAYRLYTLALAKSPEVGAMNRLREFKYISPEAKWRLAAAYQLIGQSNTALDLISGTPKDFSNRINPGFTYGSALRDQAMVLETLTLMGKRNQAQELVITVANQLSEDAWYSTQTTAYALIAVSKFCGKNPSGQKIMATVKAGPNSNTINSTSYMREIPLDMRNGNVPVTIVNNGSNTLYFKMITRGQPLTGDSLRQPNNPALLSMNIAYLNNNGSPLDIKQIRQGTDFVAKVTVTNTGKRGYYEQMALSQVFPAGWEILNPRLNDAESAFKSSTPVYQDVRDDRVYTYFNLRQGETQTYYIQLNAAYLGRYYLPSNFCQAMYDNSISASTPGNWVEVVN
jgi:uncharacterized protein YfaS (alpha-2-macroglobulin family)